MRAEPSRRIAQMPNSNASIRAARESRRMSRSRTKWRQQVSVCVFVCVSSRSSKYLPSPFPILFRSVYQLGFTVANARGQTHLYRVTHSYVWQRVICNSSCFFRTCDTGHHFPGANTAHEVVLIHVVLHSYA